MTTKSINERRTFYARQRRPAPVLHSALPASAHEYSERSEKFESIEKKMFGTDGFDEAVKKIGKIEQHRGSFVVSRDAAPAVVKINVVLFSLLTILLSVMHCIEWQQRILFHHELVSTKSFCNFPNHRNVLEV